MPFVTKYDFAIITNYPELKGYLEQQLRKLGRIREVDSPLRPPYYSYYITLKQAPDIIDWAKRDNREYLHINSDGGGCFVSPLSVTVGKLPKPGTTECSFNFDLSLDSRSVPLGKHDEALVKHCIDEFVQRLGKGIVTHFSGAQRRWK